MHIYIYINEFSQVLWYTDNSKLSVMIYISSKYCNIDVYSVCVNFASYKSMYQQYQEMQWLTWTSNVKIHC